ncbi:hypothetical protein D5018_14235 [Parashewanella curva]|uniref:Uncharacterized protein n=1 Tax=Parashewanella curva TaxID=2338552 RepID=A0A3L8PUF1_9GAMM|nr:tetratricopeptide repeat protein [Parashewanella curva]RLV59047.1 hypothetical protein D5018_14235 [Parashewanella curva]
MSVINKMLKDLEQRQQPHDLSNVSRVQIVEDKDNRWKQMSVILLSLLIAFVAIAGGYWWYSNQQPKSEVEPKTELSLAQAPAKTQLTSAKKINHPDKTSEIAVAEQAVDTNQAPKSEAGQLEKQTVQPQPQSEAKSTTPVEVAAQAKALQPKAQQLKVKPETVAKPAKQEQKPVLQIKEVKLTPKQLAAKFYKQALQAQEDGELNSAIDLFSKVLEFSPAQHQAREKLAALLYGKQSYAEAMQVLSDGISKYPQHSMFSLLLAKVQYQVKQPLEALYSLEKIPNNSELATQKWVQIGRIAQQQKQYSRAVEAYNQLIHIEPEQSRWWLGLAFNLDSQAQYAEASNAYKQALLSSNLSPASENYVQQRLQQLAAHSLASKEDGSAQ